MIVNAIVFFQPSRLECFFGVCFFLGGGGGGGRGGCVADGFSCSVKMRMPKKTGLSFQKSLGDGRITQSTVATFFFRNSGWFFNRDKNQNKTKMIAQ